MTVNSSRVIKFSWASQLYDYEDNYGEHPMLAEILSLQQERVMIEKNISWLEHLILEERLKSNQSLDAAKL